MWGITLCLFLWTDTLYDESRMALDNKAVEVQKLAEEYNRALAIATKDANLTLVRGHATVIDIMGMKKTS